AVYRTSAEAASLLRITATDDLDGSLSLCQVEVYETDEAVPPEEEPVASTDGCASDGTCSIERWLSAGKSYLIVLWAAPPEETQPHEASFSLEASVKLASTLTTKIYGHRIKDGCSGYHEVVNGIVFKIVSTTTTTSTGIVEVRIDRKSGSSWLPHASYDRALAEGVTSLSLTAGASGLYRIRTTLPEETTTLAETVTLYVAHVTPKWVRYADGGVRLTVPWYHQQHRLSCEGAALRMAHNFFKPGSIDRDMWVLRTIGIDERKKKGNRWGNPNKRFVGDPNGRMMTTGYGVHWGPIAYAATRFSPCRPAVVLKKPSRPTIAGYVARGFPVIVWGAHSGPTGIYKKRWKAWDGEWVTAWSVEHVWVVVGFHGPASKPTSFIIHDPSGPARRVLSLRQFDEFTKYFRRAVVV
ncbi:MAG: C39 family peptidase, partial [Actinomycetota bacterium]